MIKGHALLNAERGVRLTAIAGWEVMPALRQPQYLYDEEFRPFRLVDLDWMHRFREVFRAIEAACDAQGEVPKLVDMALVAYAHGLQAVGIDLRLPAFVRAAEVILALPRGAGARVFAERALHFLGSIAADGYLAGNDIGELLEQVYQLRNDCVHGKHVEDELRIANRARLVWRYEYVAELLAQQVALWATRECALVRSIQSRADLEAAWTNHRLPPI